MASLVEQQLLKMGLQREMDILSKTTELMRLLDLRSANMPLQINEYAKVILCADLAASIIGVAFDREDALRVSGLRKMHYLKHKRMVEKLLELNRIVGINDICTHLNINEVAKKANELLDLYKEVVVRENPEVDLSHPQYAAMAVFYACKLIKGKVSKPKIMSFSNLRPTQWLQLEQHWAIFMTKHYKSTMESNSTQNTMRNLQEKNNSYVKPLSKNFKIEVEDYEKWKNRMIEMAERKLKTERSEFMELEKGN